MITTSLKHYNTHKGVKSLRMNINGPIVQVNSKECIFLHMDDESGGVWYQLDPAKMAIPMEEGRVYIPPQSIVAIQFNE